MVGTAAGEGQSAVFRHVATAANTLNDTTTLDHSLLNGNNSARPLVTQLLPSGSGPFNANSVYLIYLGDRWRVVNREYAAIPIGAEFSVWVPRPTAQEVAGAGTTYLHSTGPANTTLNYSRLDHPQLNGKPGAFLHATQQTGGLIGGTELGVAYEAATARWTVFRQDLQSMQTGGVFFTICIGGCGIGGGAGIVHTHVEHCASTSAPICYTSTAEGSAYLPLVTADSMGTYNDHPIGLWWDGVSGEWAFMNLDLQEIGDTDFFLSFTDLIFESGFETGDSLGWVTSP